MPAERVIIETYRNIQYHQIPSIQFYIWSDNSLTKCKTDCQTEKRNSKDDLKIIFSKIIF